VLGQGRRSRNTSCFCPDGTAPTESLRQLFDRIPDTNEDSLVATGFDPEHSAVVWTCGGQDVSNIG
jgi:hypothetical protein